MDTLTSLKVFRQVVESSGFGTAAERLDLSTAMVRKHIMHIERRLGVRLLHRNNRSLSLTEPGRLYLERCTTLLDDLEQTEMELGSLSGEPRGTLRITGPSWFSGRTLADLLAMYRQRYPEVVIDLSLEDRLVDLVDEGFDLALRVTPHALSGGLIARPVRPIAFLIGASRKYLERNGTPQSPEELSSHDCIAVTSFESWRLCRPHGNIDVPARVVMRYRSTAGVVNAVAAGIGVAPLPQLYFEDPVFSDVLTPVLPEYPLQKPTLYLVYVSRKHIPLKIRTFIDHFVEYASGAAAGPRRT
jgi:DNA-binding transcriptional LysR family regulator